MNYANGSELLPHFSSVMVAIATSVPTHMNVSKNSAPTGGGRQLRKITREDLKKITIFMEDQIMYKCIFTVIFWGV